MSESPGTPTTRDCPACTGKLFAAPDRNGVFGCNACGGIWADIETSQLIAAVLDPDLVDLADRAASHAARTSGGAALPAEGERRCPQCHELLARVHTASTNLDVCIMHGTWFDRGELQRVSRKLDADRGRQIPRGPQGEARWVAGNTSLNAARGAPPVDTAAVAADIAGGLAVEAGFMAFRTLLEAAAGGNRRGDDD